MGLLTKEQILSSNDRPTQDMEVPEWGGTVRIRSMTGAERDTFETEMFGLKDPKQRAANMRARLVSRCLVNEAGERLFSDKEAIELGKKSCAALDRVYEVVAKLNRLTVEDEKELTKNSDAAPNESSTSA